MLDTIPQWQIYRWLEYAQIEELGGYVSQDTQGKHGNTSYTTSTSSTHNHDSTHASLLQGLIKKTSHVSGRQIFDRVYQNSAAYQKELK